MQRQGFFFLCGVSLLAAACALLPRCVAAAENRVSLASAVAPPSATSAGAAFAPRFSADGRFLIFFSNSRNLTTNENYLGTMNVFMKELATGTISMVSVDSSGFEGGNEMSSSPAVSSNGQFVTFESAASNLVPGDRNGFNDIFLRDTVSGETTMVSSGYGGSGGNGHSGNPSITPDGRYVIFESSASNLITNDVNGIPDIFRWDRINAKVELVTLRAGGNANSNIRSKSPFTTPDGRWIAFVSNATNLVPKIGPVGQAIFLRDMQSTNIQWMSSNANVGSLRCYNPVVLKDGSGVVFKGFDANRTTNLTLLKKVNSTNLIAVSTNTEPTSYPAVLDNNAIVTEQNGRIVVWNPEDGSLNTISPAPRNSWEFSYQPVVSLNGRRIAFLSNCTNVTSNAVSAAKSRTPMQLFAHDLSSGTTRLANPDLMRRGSSDLTGSLYDFGSDGADLAFEDLSPELILMDKNSASDVFIYNWNNDSVQVASSVSGSPRNVAPNGISVAGPSSMSANGRLIAISSTDTNLYQSGTTNAFNSAVWDTQRGTNIILSLLPKLNGTNTSVTQSGAQGPTLSLNGAFLVDTATVPFFYYPLSNSYALNLETGASFWMSKEFFTYHSGRSCCISADTTGGFVAFESTIFSLASPLKDQNGTSDVFIHDLATDTRSLVSISIGGQSTGNSRSINPLLSKDSRWVVFQSAATDLTTNAFSSSSNLLVFARSLEASNTFLLSCGENGMSLQGNGRSHVVSLNSKVVAFDGNFQWAGTNTPLIMAYDLLNHTNMLVCTNCQNPTLDAAGRWITYESLPGSGRAGDVFAKDLQTGTEVLISVNRNGTAGGNARSAAAVISSDARYVVFESKAGDLVTNDPNGFTDVFVRDRNLSTTTLLSVNRSGSGSGNGPSGRPVLSADGRTVAFQSMASDLAPGDYNGFRDVFLARLIGRDSDNDGLDDGWEVTYFGNLGRDGTSDFDGDGQTELEELRSGTDPTNQGSVLQVRTILGARSGPTTIVWDSVAGQTYRVQFKDSVEATAWTDLPGLVVASSGVCTVEHAGPAISQRFYRVVLTQ